jgi:1,2-dihydroxy-3-keto-5-methylthiopentene dioxygenase
MSVLRVYSERDPARAEEFTAPEAIARAASEAQVRFERWSATADVADVTAQAAVLEAYASDVARLKELCGFATADVISVRPSTPNHAELRSKFLSEHTHSEDEARFFVEGSGMFCVHHQERIYAFVCERGDLLNVPAGTRHWFDMGPTPHFTCIRMFTDPAGWVASFTGSDIAAQFPRYEAP